MSRLPETQFARFASRTQQIATSFLHVPLTNFIKLNDQEFEDNFLLTIGLPPFTVDQCANCNRPFDTSIEDHGVAKWSLPIRKRIGSMIERGVRLGLSQLFQNVSSSEPILDDLPGWIPKEPHGNKYRADLLTDHCGTPKIIDVSVTTKYPAYRSTYYKKYPNAPTRLIDTSIPLSTLDSSIPSTDKRTILDFFSGLAASNREKGKRKTYNKRLSFPPNQFVPFGIKSHGGIGVEFNNYLYEARKYLQETSLQIPRTKDPHSENAPI